MQLRVRKPISSCILRTEGQRRLLSTYCAPSPHCLSLKWKDSKSERLKCARMFLKPVRGFLRLRVSIQERGLPSRRFCIGGGPAKGQRMKWNIVSRSQEVLWKLLFLIINQTLSKTCPSPTCQPGEPVIPVGHPRATYEHSKQRPPQACGHRTPSGGKPLGPCSCP